MSRPERWFTPRPSRPFQPSAPGPRAEGQPALRAGGIATLGVVVGLFLDVVIGFVWVLAGGSINDTSSPLLVLFSEIGLWVGLAGSCLVASRVKGTGSLVRDFGLRTGGWIDLPIGVVTGLVGLFMSAVVAGVLHYVNPQLVGSNSSTLTSHRQAWALAISGVIACVGAPVVEELFFRGLIQGTLLTRIGAWALPAQAGLFALAHYQPGEGLGNVGILLVIFLLGCLLGYLRQRTRRLVPGMVAHSTFNLVGLALAIAAGSS